LSAADVVLYDALVNTELLKYTRKEAKRIFVGKRSNSHVYSQDEINKMIVEYAFTFGHVVRLKGGDPFVFGKS
jgi:uroporphyrin-III C-methyltransferase